MRVAARLPHNGVDGRRPAGAARSRNAREDDVRSLTLFVAWCIPFVPSRPVALPFRLLGHRRA
jgi:hypothetical protein